VSDPTRFRRGALDPSGIAEPLLAAVAEYWLPAGADDPARGAEDDRASFLLEGALGIAVDDGPPEARAAVIAFGELGDGFVLREVEVDPPVAGWVWPDRGFLFGELVGSGAWEWCRRNADPALARRVLGAADTTRSLDFLQAPVVGSGELVRRSDVLLHALAGEYRAILRHGGPAHALPEPDDDPDAWLARGCSWLLEVRSLLQSARAHRAPADVAGALRALDAAHAVARSLILVGLGRREPDELPIVRDDDLDRLLAAAARRNGGPHAF
jgi:hypothetical protein